MITGKNLFETGRKYLDMWYHIICFIIWKTYYMISLQIILELRPIKWEETQPCQEPGEKLSGRGNSMRNPQVSERPTGGYWYSGSDVCPLRGTQTGLKEIYRKIIHVQPFCSSCGLGSTWASVTLTTQGTPRVNNTRSTTRAGHAHMERLC